MVNDKRTKMSAGIVPSHWDSKQQTNENRVELRQTAFIKTWNIITHWNQIRFWGAEKSPISKEVRQHAMDMKGVAFFIDEMGIRRR